VTRKQYSNLNGYWVSVQANQLDDLSNDSNIVYITPDRSLRAADAASLDYHYETVHANAKLPISAGLSTDLSTTLDPAGLELTSASLTGRGISVAIIDSGIAHHSDFASRIVYAESFVKGEDAYDYFGHGTHVAGIIAGDATASNVPGTIYNFLGLAPQASLINMKVLNSHGEGQVSSVLAAIDRVIALKNVYSIRVINLSLGMLPQEGIKADPMCQAVEAAWRAGIVVVVAAGNEGANNSAGTNGYASITSPGNDPYVITVGAGNTVSTPNPF